MNPVLIATERRVPLIAVIVFSLSVFSVAEGGSPLEDAAASLSPGEWGQLDTEGMSAAFLRAESTNYATNYSDNAVWDPVSRSFLFVGGPHGSTKRFLRYDESTNAWSELPLFSTSATHGYDHNAIDVEGRVLYHRQHRTDRVWAFSLESETWSEIPPIDSAYTSVAGGLEFFPELNAPGTLVFFDGNFGEFVSYDPRTRAWTREASGLEMANYHNFAEYNPIHEVIIFGGGNDSSDLHVLYSDGRIETKKSAPIELGIHRTIITVDPVSGEYLVFANGGLFYTYDVVNDVWTLVSDDVPVLSPSLNPQVTGIVAAPISNHGIVMFLKYHPEATGVYLYKHEETVRPTSPGNLSAE